MGTAGLWAAYGVSGGGRCRCPPGSAVPHWRWPGPGDGDPTREGTRCRGSGAERRQSPPCPGCTARPGRGSDAAALSLSFATETAAPGCSSRSDSAPTAPCHGRAMPCHAAPPGLAARRGPAMPSPALPARSASAARQAGAAGPGVPVSAGADGPPPCLTLAHTRRSVAALASRGRLHVSCGCRHRRSHMHTRRSHTGVVVPVCHTRVHVTGCGCACHTLSLSHARRGPRLCVSRLHVGSSRGLALPVTCTHAHACRGPQLCLSHTHVHGRRGPWLRLPCTSAHAHQPSHVPTAHGDGSEGVPTLAPLRRVAAQASRAGRAPVSPPRWGWPRRHGDWGSWVTSLS